jgi:hypothetical protein
MLIFQEREFNRVMRGRLGKDIVELRGLLKYKRCSFFNFVVFNIVCGFN